MDGMNGMNGNAGMDGRIRFVVATGLEVVLRGDAPCYYGKLEAAIGDASRLTPMAPYAVSVWRANSPKDFPAIDVRQPVFELRWLDLSRIEHKRVHAALVSFFGQREMAGIEPELGILGRFEDITLSLLPEDRAVFRRAIYGDVVAWAAASRGVELIMPEVGC